LTACPFVGLTSLTMSSSASIPASQVLRPEVIVDFNCEQGLLFILLKNIGARSAYGVATTFDKPLYGLNGEKCISDLQLFRRVEFVPPGKQFSQLVDPVASWFKRRRPSRVTVNIAYRDREGNRYSERITHDLRIYQDLGYMRISRSGGTSVEPTG
jgi:hypothetical protein